MTDLPGADETLRVYEDQVEALEGLFRARAAIAATAHSRFSGLSMDAIEDRLRLDREELDLWAVMLLVASFEGTVRADALARIRDKMFVPGSVTVDSGAA